MDEAFEALHADHPTLAKKISQRAIDLGFVNPRLWLDHGTIHHAAGDLETAEASFRQAIALAPDFGEAFLQLSRLQDERGKHTAAARLLRRAADLRPDLPEIQVRLAALAATESETSNAERPSEASAVAAPVFTERTEEFDWNEVEELLRAQGMARLPHLLTESECKVLIALWETECFEHEVHHSGEPGGGGAVSYRFFSRPLPPLVAALREELYARLSAIANRIQEQLGRSARFPAHLADYLERCSAAGQHRTTPILLRYPPGGDNAPHRDISGAEVFPFQLAVTLGPGHARAGEGGSLRLIDQRPGKKLREKRLDTGIGDGVVFCSRERLVQVGGAFGLQPVLHGVTACARERFCLGVPFHEHR